MLILWLIFSPCLMFDYNHHPILTTTMPEVQMEFQGRCATTTLCGHKQGSALFLLGTNAIKMQVIRAIDLIQLSNNVRVYLDGEGSDHLLESITERLLITEHLPEYYSAVLGAQLDKVPSASVGVEEQLICPAEDGNVFIVVCNKTGEVVKIVQNIYEGGRW